MCSGASDGARTRRIAAGGSAAPRRQHRKDRHARLDQRRLGERAAGGLVAVGEEHEGGLLAFRAERRRGDERGGEVGVAGLEPGQVAGRPGSKSASARPRRCRVRDHVGARGERDRAEEVVRTERGEQRARETRGHDPPRRAATLADTSIAATMQVPASRPRALDVEPGEREHDRGGGERATRRRGHAPRAGREEERQRREREQHGRRDHAEGAEPERQRNHERVSGSHGVRPSAGRPPPVGCARRCRAASRAPARRDQ